MKQPELKSIAAILKFLKTNCRFYHADKIRIAPRKSSYEPYQVHIILDGKFHTMEMHDFDFSYHLHAFKGYFGGGQWTDTIFYQPYTNEPGKALVNIPSGPAIGFLNEKEFQANCQKVRAKSGLGQDMGFEQIPQPENFVTLREYLSN